MVRRICGIVIAIVLPILFEATSGCTLDTSGLCGPDCLRDAAHSNTNSYVCSCSCGAGPRHREIRVSASVDDAEESTSDGAVVLDSPDLDLTFGQIVGLRFRDVGIPNGADILGAYVQFTASGDDNLVLSFQIVGEDSANAAAFSTAAHNVSSRPPTGNSVTWTPGAWASGTDQSTPDLQLILEEIVDQPLWSPGNALVLRISATAGNGTRQAYSQDGKPLSAPVLIIDYEEPVSAQVGPQDLPVCVPPALNPNTGGVSPIFTHLANDCGGRVQETLSGLASACGYPSDCTCSAQSGSERFADACDATCVENTVDTDCADFDPVAGNVQATNAPGDVPVCLANSPLAFGIYGRRTSCAVSGMAHVELEGEPPDPQPSATGILQFRGDPCPGAPCAVAMEHRLDIGDIIFDEDEIFKNLAGLGKSAAGMDAALSASGDGTFGAGACFLSARGEREDEQLALATANLADIDINVTFGATATGPSCALAGNLIGDAQVNRCEEAGSVCTEDDDCPDGDECSEVPVFVLGLDVAGSILNQPPTANAGTDQTVECPARAVLDATASSDLDDNITLFSWLRDSRTGDQVGFEEVSMVEQGLGTETYVLRVIDALGQADEDTTDVTVVDTTPPELTCSVAMPVLNATNHNMFNVGLASIARDACEGDLPVTVSVFADEDDEAQTGDGKFSPDGKSIGVGSLRLRAERQGNGDGRVYLILVEATDSSGNRGINCCTVIVPHSRAQAALQAAQGQAAAAQAFCLANEGDPPSGYFVVGDGPVIGPKQ